MIPKRKSSAYSNGKDNKEIVAIMNIKEDYLIPARDAVIIIRALATNFTDVQMDVVAMMVNNLKYSINWASLSTESIIGIYMYVQMEEYGQT